MKLFHILCFLLIIETQLYAESQRLSFVADPFCPYTCTENKPNGFVVDTVRMIFEKEGYEVVYLTLPWERAKREVMLGKHDGILGIVEYDLKELRLICPREESAVLEACFYKRRGDKWEYTGLQSLNKIRLGLIMGYSYEIISIEFVDYLRTHKDSVQYLPGHNANRRNFVKLINNRVDAVLNDKSSAQYIINSNDFGARVSEAGCFNVKIPVYVGFPESAPESKKYAEIFDKGIRTLRKTSQMDKILSKYHISDWK